MAVAKAIEDDAYLYTLGRFARQQVEKSVANAIVLEFEIIEMNEAPGPFDVGKQGFILAYTGGENCHGVTLVEGKSHRKEVFPCPLSRLLGSNGEQRNQQEQGDGYRSLNDLHQHTISCNGNYPLHRAVHAVH